MTRPGRLAAAGLLVLALALAGLLRAAPPADAATADQPSARITIGSIAPALLDPKATLTVSGTVTNAGTVPLVLVGARLRLLDEQLGTRAQVAAWDGGDDPRTGTVVGATLDVQPRTIAVGASAPFTLAVPGTQLGLAGQPFGAYGLAVEVRAQGELGRQQVGLLRTTVQWQPGRKEYNAQQIAWLVPITTTAAEATASTPAQVAAAVGPGSRLRRVLDAASAPGVGWAVDPALLQTLTDVATPRSATPPVPSPSATATPTATPSPASTATQSPAPSPAPSPSPSAGPGTPAAVVGGFLADLRAAAAGRTVVELPYADPDLVAVTDGGRTDLLRAAQASGAGIVEQVLGVTPMTGVGWPADGWAGDRTLAALAGVGTTDVVLDARARRLVDAVPYTTDAHADLAAGVSGWLADPTLSALVASRATGVLPVQRILAETAAATSERPGLVRRLLVAAPRGLDPDPTTFRTLVQATSSVPWLSLVPAGGLRSPAPGSLSDGSADLPRTATPEPAAVARAELPRAHVAAVRRIRSTLSAVGEVVDDAPSVTGGLQRQSLQLLSAAWRGHLDLLRTRRAAVAADVAALSDQLVVLRTSVNFLTSSGRLQITVANNLPVSASGLQLRVTSTNPRLRVIRTDVPVPDLAAGTRAQVQVPVQALGSGKVRLNAQLVSPSGRLLGRLEQVSVRVRPTDTWALWLVGGIVAVVLVVGLVRTLRRPRRAQRPAGDPR